MDEGIEEVDRVAAAELGDGAGIPEVVDVLVVVVVYVALAVTGSHHL